MASYTPAFWQDWATKHRVPLDPCSEAAVAAMEARLSCPPLPPSYRNFLLTVGCPATAVHFEHQQLLPLDKVQWFKDNEENDAWIRNYEDQGTDLDKEFDGWKVSDLRRTLQVTDVTESVYLLNPGKVDQETGEWSAWLFASWVPGALVHANFGVLLTDGFQQMKELLANQAGEDAGGSEGAGQEGKVEVVE